MYNQQKL